MMEAWLLQIWSLRTQVVQTALEAENPSQMATPLQRTLPLQCWELLFYRHNKLLKIIAMAQINTSSCSANVKQNYQTGQPLLTAVKGRQRHGARRFPANSTRTGDFSSLFWCLSCTPHSPGSPTAAITRSIVGVFLSLLYFLIIQFELLWKERISAGFLRPGARPWLQVCFSLLVLGVFFVYFASEETDSGQPQWWWCCDVWSLSRMFACWAI